MRFMRLKWKSEKGVEVGACWGRNSRLSRRTLGPCPGGRSRQGL